jgi:predicted SnoaL-like aldol condensation-catalyzing enzyme
MLRVSTARIIKETVMTRLFKNIALGVALALPAWPLTSLTAHAQEAVVKVPDVEALFTSPDPKLHANKQVTYKIIRDLLEAGHWDKADQYLTERYIQHNPNAASGRDGVVTYFTKVLKVQPKPIPEKTSSPVVFVSAEGDLVTVGSVRQYKDPKDPSKTYTTTWYDTWRFVDGKADEHWDSALKAQ